LIYHACEGRAGDIDALERKTYWDFCNVLDNHLERVEVMQKSIDKMNKK